MYLNVRFIILTRITLAKFLFNWFIKNIGRGILYESDENLYSN